MIVGDERRALRLTPLVTYGLIALNVLVFLLELSGGEPFIIEWSFVPARFLANPEVQFITIFTAMFMHANELHILGNMLYLWIFGDNVEDRFGHAKFLAFYLACGVLATFAQLFFNPNSQIPNLGASGAISGVLGAYLVLFPQGRVFISGGRGVIPVPALAAIGIWFLLQVFGGLGSIGAADTGGVAFMAHIGGFVAGFVLTYLFGGRRTVQFQR
jgi:membrane associated rhomboid family serine protease